MSLSLATKTENLKVKFIILFTGICSFAEAQVTLSGTVTERSGAALPGVVVKVLKTDSSFVTGVSSDIDGAFSLKLPPDNNYIVVAALLSYKNYYKNLAVKNETISLGQIRLKESSQNLSEVEVKTTQIRGEQKGDTTQFNAAAYKTNPDASAEDLVKKMPGVTNDNEGLKVNGETVQKVLVDGKPFFGDDPSAALKNLPADVIDKVEVFDKLSDQSQFTGFNDGDQQKTINIVTKKGKNMGQFGKVYAGGGTDEDPKTRYNAGAVINSFKDKQRFSLLLLSNNVNQQNFSASDLTGAMGSSSQGGNRGGGSRQRNSSPLLTTPQNGNSLTHSAGMNYSDEWGKKINVSGSYFYNYSDNINQSNVVRNYFTDDKLTYSQTNDDQKINQNHRFNFRFEYAIDSANKLTLTPSLSFQDNRAYSLINAENSISDNILLSRTGTILRNDNLGYDLSNNALYQHKFRKEGRTISLNINTQLSERDNDGNYRSSGMFSDSLYTELDQQFNTYSYNKKISANLAYTEGLGKFSQLQVNYNPSYTEGKSDKSTKDRNTITNDYDNFNTALSNKYINYYETQRAGLSYKYKKNKLNLSVGADAQQSTLNGKQTFPTNTSLRLPFRNILPNAQLNYKMSKSKNLRINYRSSTDIPSISQLQNVVDISNPLQVRSGNPALKQSFENSLNIRFGGFDPVSSRNAMLFMNASTTANYISNATYILKNDSVVDTYPLKAGTQLTKPVNLEGYYSGRLFFVLGFPVKIIKSNLNFNGGVNYYRTPGLINNLFNYSSSYATNGGIFIGSNVSENLDFSLGYNGNYTMVRNTTNKGSNTDYFSHAATFRINWILLRGLVINTDVTNTLYKGLSQDFDQDYFLWNAYIGYKLLKNKSLEAKVSVFDLLNQNRSVNRTITGAYSEDSYTNVLRRYAMFTLTYTFKNFAKGSTVTKNEETDRLKNERPPRDGK